MLTFAEYARPASAAEAYTMLQGEGAGVLAGGLYLRMSDARLARLVSLDGCGLAAIEKTANGIEIGAMVTERTLETDPVCAAASGGLLARAVRHIMGVQVRNMATIGGSVWGRYGFSDLITALLALEARVRLHKGGELDLGAFLDAPRPAGDLLTAVIIPAGPVTSAWQDQRLTATDFPALNVAVVKAAGGWRIAVGSRPARGVLATKAMALVNKAADVKKAAAEAGRTAAAELEFGSDLRGGADYRRELCAVLVERALEEAAR